MSESANSRINNYWERLALWACGAIIALLCLAYQDQRSQLSNLEDKVNFLYQDKVSRGELKEEINRVVTQIQATKSDIIARIDIYFSREKQH